MKFTSLIFEVVPNPSFYQHHFLVCVYFLSLFAESQELTETLLKTSQPSGSVSKRGKFFLCTVFVPRVQPVCVRQCRDWGCIGCPMYQTNEFLTAQNSCLVWVISVMFGHTSHIWDIATGSFSFKNGENVHFSWKT